MPYVPSSTFGRASLGANGAANKLFIVFLFSDPRRRTFLEGCGANSKQYDVLLSAVHKCLGASTPIATTVIAGDVGGRRLLPCLRQSVVARNR